MRVNSTLPAPMNATLTTARQCSIQSFRTSFEQDLPRSAQICHNLAPGRLDSRACTCAMMSDNGRSCNHRALLGPARRVEARDERHHWLALRPGVLAIALGLAGCGSDAQRRVRSAGGPISIWEGCTGVGGQDVRAPGRASTSKQNPGTKVNSLFVNNDNTLQKVLTAVRGGSPPDIAYLYGSWAPNVAQIPQVVNLTQLVQPARRELERLLGRRAGRGHRQRQGHRHPRAGGQPRRGLQQEAVRPGPPQPRPARAGPGSSSWPTPRSSPTRQRSSSAPRM